MIESINMKIYHKIINFYKIGTLPNCLLMTCEFVVLPKYTIHNSSMDKKLTIIIYITLIIIQSNIN